MAVKRTASEETTQSNVTLPKFNREDVPHTKLYFPDGKPSNEVRSMLKARKFRFQPNLGNGDPYWIGETENLKDTPFAKAAKK